MRENQSIKLHSTRRVYEWIFESNPIFGGLIQSSRFSWEELENRHPVMLADGQLAVEAVFVEGKVPTHVKVPTDDLTGATIALLVTDGDGHSLLHVPAVKRISAELLGVASRCDCILFDGSFWWDDEMERRGVGTRTSLTMGHVPIDGPYGSLARLSHLRTRKVYTHVNNTNPILDEDSPQRRAIEAAGWEVAEDGMDFTL